MTTTSDIWCPKVGFKGLVFAKFADISTRDRFVAKISTIKPEYEGDKVWAQVEASVEARACGKFLSGLKKILVGWGFDPNCILWDTEGAENTLKINNVVKVIVTVVDGKIHCEWEQSCKKTSGVYKQS